MRSASSAKPRPRFFYGSGSTAIAITIAAVAIGIAILTPNPPDCRAVERYRRPCRQVGPKTRVNPDHDDTSIDDNILIRDCDNTPVAVYFAGPACGHLAPLPMIDLRRWRRPVSMSRFRPRLAGRHPAEWRAVDW